MPTTAAHTRPPGHPPQSRAPRGSAAAANTRWTLRNLPKNIRKTALETDEGRGITTGDWVAKAIDYYAMSARKSDTRAARSLSATLPAARHPIRASQTMNGRLSKFQQDWEKKLAALFRQTPDHQPRRRWPWSQRAA